MKFPALRLIGFLCLAVTIVALVGCAKHPPASTAPQILRLSQRNEPADLDPATASLPDEYFIIRALAEGLLVPNPNGGAPLPGAAESYEVSDDRLTYTFHLWPDARWSNGEPLTADDFATSFRRALTPATAAPKAHLFFAVANAHRFATGEEMNFDAVGIHATDARTLVVRLEKPVANFPLYVATGAWIPVNPRIVARYGRNWTDPEHYVGNGPFVLAEWRSQQRIVVRRNPRYRDAARVALDEIQFIRLDNQETEERAFRAGQIDVTMAVPSSKLDVYTREHPDELLRSPLAETRFLSFNTHRAPLNDVRVRRALALAIDRQKIVTFVLRGGQRVADRFLSPELFDAKTPPREQPARQGHNPDAARRLLAEAGYPQGAGFPRLELAGWVQNPVLEAIQQMWRQELGIEVGIVVQEAKVHLAALTAGTYDIAFATNLLDVRDPVAALEDFTAAAANNFPHWASPEFDGLIEKAERLTTPAEQAATATAAETLLLRDAAVAPIYFNAQNWLMSPRVHGWQQDAIWARRYNDVRIE